MVHHTSVIILGGGYAGVTAANRLTQREDVAVTLVNPRSSFVERIRLHQLVGGSDDALVDYGDILADRVRLIAETITSIDPAERTVTSAGGATLHYDYLVYAVGSRAGRPDVPGAAEFAYPIADLEDAQRLRRIAEEAPAAATTTVVGGGPLGIEVAAELAEAGRSVTLVCGDTLGPSLHPRGRRSVARLLAKRNVRVLVGPGTRVTAVTGDAVILADGRALASTITIWAAGFGVPDLAARSGLSTDAMGRLLTDETLTSIDDERVVAAGDAAAPSDLPFRMSCQAAGQLGAHAADTVLSRMAGRTPTPVAIGFVGLCLSLGRRRGLFQVEHGDDTATRVHIGGRAGARIKQIVCWGTIKQLEMEAARPGSTSLPAWATDRSRPARVLAAAKR